jgi:hypothetical protein
MCKNCGKNCELNQKLNAAVSIELPKEALNKIVENWKNRKVYRISCSIYPEFFYIKDVSLECAVLVFVDYMNPPLSSKIICNNVEFVVGLDGVTGRKFAHLLAKE